MRAISGPSRTYGAILFGRANLHELAAGGTSSNPTFGSVRNPYDPACIAGGSGGGTAAALSARIVSLGLGEDTGGSVRIPAGFCGVCGLRPSTWPRKRYSDAGLIPAPAPDDTQTIGPMARSVADLDLLDCPMGPLAFRFTLFGARLGVPGLVLPAGLTHGLPVGLELEGLPGADRQLLAIGMALEKVLGPLPPPGILSAGAAEHRA